jgi:hypothetical protein
MFMQQLVPEQVHKWGDMIPEQEDTRRQDLGRVRAGDTVRDVDRAVGG